MNSWTMRLAQPYEKLEKLAVGEPLTLEAFKGCPTVVHLYTRNLFYFQHKIHTNTC